MDVVQETTATSGNHRQLTVVRRSSVHKPPHNKGIWTLLSLLSADRLSDESSTDTCRARGNAEADRLGLRGNCSPRSQRSTLPPLYLLVFAPTCIFAILRAAIIPPGLSAHVSRHMSPDHPLGAPTVSPQQFKKSPAHGGAS